MVGYIFEVILIPVSSTEYWMKYNYHITTTSNDKYYNWTETSFIKMKVDLEGFCFCF